MTTLATLATVLAAATGQAQPRTTVRHTHLSERPLVLVPLRLAGEACAPLAVMCGTTRDEPTVLTVTEPRNRDERFAFAARLADVVLPYVDGFAATTETYQVGRGKEREDRERCADAPQLLVPNPGGISFLRLLGRSTRLRATSGHHAVSPLVPLLGRWLTWFADQADVPGASVLLAATTTLTEHWASGQSALEDGNLATLLAWIDPPAGHTGAEAARLAEDPAAYPPAGPATDPLFDQSLIRLIESYASSSADTPEGARGRAAWADRVERELTRVLTPTWQLMWRAIDLLRALPAGASVADRWTGDRIRFSEYLAHVAAGGAPQPRRDHAVAAARRLDRLESAAARYAVQRAYDDPLVMAEAELAGDAFTGVVTAVDADRVVGRSRQPLITVRAEQPPTEHLRTAKLVSPARPKQNANIRAVTFVEGDRAGCDVELELSGGMGQGIKNQPPSGSLPALGEHVCYTSLRVSGFVAQLPEVADTPWTHGGPPVAYQPTDEDGAEEWE
jgi:hypothetical protein